MSARSFRMMLSIALLVAVLDALGAIVVYKADPIKMFQFIASGAFGKEAFAGGTIMAVYGMIFHFLIALFWTAIFFLIYPRWKSLWSANKVIVAIGYGIIIWIVMNRIILPFANIPTGPFDWQKAAVATLILIFMVSLPIVYLTARHYRR